MTRACDDGLLPGPGPHRYHRSIHSIPMVHRFAEPYLSFHGSVRQGVGRRWRHRYGKKARCCWWRKYTGLHIVVADNALFVLCQAIVSVIVHGVLGGSEPVALIVTLIVGGPFHTPFVGGPFHTPFVGGLWFHLGEAFDAQ